ncbi:hypothetical protein [Burkholderia ubonensis]|uniref:hypothetical protein n=1 Tax=Burkholderia ubonensis TaxID=101571 RepID=UPI000A85A150|nr:hypothetical protein [Burkholderia ubonensis]
MQVNAVTKKPAVSAVERVEPTTGAHNFSDYLNGRLPPQMREKKPNSPRVPRQPDEQETAPTADNHYRPGALLNVEA